MHNSIVSVITIRTPLVPRQDLGGHVVRGAPRHPPPRAAQGKGEANCQMQRGFCMVACPVAGGALRLRAPLLLHHPRLLRGDSYARAFFLTINRMFDVESFNKFAAFPLIPMLGRPSLPPQWCGPLSASPASGPTPWPTSARRPPSSSPIPATVRSRWMPFASCGEGVVIPKWRCLLRNVLWLGMDGRVDGLAWVGAVVHLCFLLQVCFLLRNLAECC